MIHLEFRFPSGRYHATPWGHHVNEGLVEWPPSPWRLLRAFIATAYTKLGLSDPVPADHPLRKLVDILAAQLPSYSAAPCPVTHSRHYMPLAKDGKTTLVLDTCAVPGDEPLVVSWPVELDAVNQNLLVSIVSSMSYLGRAESWVEGQVLSETPNPGTAQQMIPHSNGINKGPGWEQISLLASTSPEDYADALAKFRKTVDAEYPLPQGKKPPIAVLKTREKALSPYPVDLYDCLTRDTAFFHLHNWSQPPGSRRVLYWRRTDSLTSSPVRTKRSFRKIQTVEAVFLALASRTKSNEVLPLISRALPQAELLHRSLVSRAGRGQPFSCPVITGKGDEGQPLKGHQHLHILPLNLDSEPGRLDHFLLWAPMGIDARAQEAILAVKETWMKGGEKPLYVTVAGMGSLDNFSPLIDRFLLGPSRIWTSCTPFVPPRHIKRHGTNSIEGQIRSELAARHPLAKVDKVELLSRDESASARLHRFVRLRREEGKKPPQDCFYGIKLTLSEEYRGPITLGYASHFGLGLFAPAS